MEYNLLTVMSWRRWSWKRIDCEIGWTVFLVLLFFYKIKMTNAWLSKCVSSEELILLCYRIYIVLDKLNSFIFPVTILQNNKRTMLESWSDEGDEKLIIRQPKCVLRRSANNFYFSSFVFILVTLVLNYCRCKWHIIVEISILRYNKMFR